MIWCNERLMKRPADQTGRRMEREIKDRRSIKLTGSMSGRLRTIMSLKLENKFFTRMSRSPFLVRQGSLSSRHVFTLSFCFSCLGNCSFSLLVFTTFSRAIETDAEHWENCMLFTINNQNILYTRYHIKRSGCHRSASQTPGLRRIKIKTEMTLS